MKDLPIPNNSARNISKKAFVDVGFRTYQNAPGAFAPHETSELHKTALMLTLNCNNKQNIVEQLSDIKRKEMLQNRIALKTIFSSIIFLTKQGLALRGHEEIKSNLHQLLLLRSEDVPELRNYMNRDGYKWLHNQSINEILHLVANEIRKKILSEIKAAKYYALTIDETSDVSKLEQVSICMRTVNEDLLINEYFMTFCNTPNTKSETLYNLVTNFLKEINLSIYDLRGQCYDGASNMSGCITGLQTLIRQVEPRALFIHCSAPCLNLCVQDGLDDIIIVRNTIAMIKDIINFIRDSPKRLNEFRNIKPDNSPILSPFCPTR